jgi:hypothetical protein
MSTGPYAEGAWTDDVASLVSNLQEIVDAFNAGNRPVRSCLIDLMEEHADFGNIIADIRASAAHKAGGERG